MFDYKNKNFRSMKLIFRGKINLLFLPLFFILVQCYSTKPSIKPAPTSAFRFYENALIDKFDGQWDDALGQINKAIILNNHIALFYVLKAQIFDSLQQVDSAIATYQQSLKVRPYAPDVLQKLGELYIFKGKQNQGITYLKKAFAFDETQTGLLLRIASLYLQIHSLSLAKDVLNDYRLRLDLAHLKPDFKYYLLMGDVYYSDNNHNAAAQYYGQCPCKSCLSEKQAITAFEALFKEKKFNVYFRLLAGVDQKKFKNGILFYYRGLYYGVIGNLTEAEHQFTLALKHGCQKPKLFYEMAKIYKKQDETQKIQNLVRRLQTIAPQSPYLSKVTALLDQK